MTSMPSRKETPWTTLGSWFSPFSRRQVFARGSFREVMPVHRLAYSFGWDGSEVVPPGSSLIEIDLIRAASATSPTIGEIPKRDNLVVEEAGFEPSVPLATSRAMWPKGSAEVVKPGSLVKRSFTHGGPTVRIPPSPPVSIIFHHNINIIVGCIELQPTKTPSTVS